VDGTALRDAAIGGAIAVAGAALIARGFTVLDTSNARPCGEYASPCTSSDREELNVYAGKTIVVLGFATLLAGGALVALSVSRGTKVDAVSGDGVPIFSGASLTPRGVVFLDLESRTC
jgi:hypothetical protein